jgi:hypothetical protein
MRGAITNIHSYIREMEDIGYYGDAFPYECIKHTRNLQEKVVASLQNLIIKPKVPFTVGKILSQDTLSQLSGRV